MPILREEVYTIKDILNLPKGERAELIDGQMYMMVASSSDHQELIADLITDINNYIRGHGGGCKVYGAPFAVFLSEDTEYVEPDISVICDPSKIDKRGCHGAPDWVIEIVSPSSRSRDCLIKLVTYREEGVREYWIVDPDRDRVTIYNLRDDIVTDYSMKDSVPVGIYNDELKIRMVR